MAKAKPKPTRPNGHSLTYVQQGIKDTCEEIKTLLLRKNADYGNAAVEPLRLFSRATPDEQLRVRIDDKLSRIKTKGLSASDEDTVLDLIGYLILLRVNKHLDEAHGAPGEE